MSTYRFVASPLEQAPDTPWRPLDRAMLRWTLGHGGSPLLARVASSLPPSSSMHRWAC